MGAALRVCQDLRQGFSHTSNSLAIAHLFSRVPRPSFAWAGLSGVAAPGPSEKLALWGCLASCSVPFSASGYFRNSGQFCDRRTSKIPAQAKLGRAPSASVASRITMGTGGPSHMFTSRPIGFVSSPYKNASEVPKGLGRVPHFSCFLREVGLRHYIRSLQYPGRRRPWATARTTISEEKS
jgi:hypothetical protein